MQRDTELLYEIGTLRFLNRTWTQFLNPNFANITEHSYRVLWIALILAKHEGEVDHAKLLKMALVHDLPEARTGDVHYISRMYTERHEDVAMKEAVKGTVLEDMYPLWEEYELRECLEAKLVKDADTLDVELEIEEQASVGIEWMQVLKEKRQKAVFPKLHTQSGRELWEKINTVKPHEWHDSAQNRMNSGDWKTE